LHKIQAKTPAKHINGHFKSVPLTLATRHQHNVALRLMNRDWLIQVDVTIGTSSEIILEEPEKGLAISSSFGNTGLLFSFYQVNWIEVKCRRYKPGLAKKDSESCTLVFLKVIHILVRDQG
jgi:hypothetical protein